MLRDISPVQWAAPGIAQLSLALVLSANNQDQVNLPTWLNAYSPTSFITRNLASGNNDFTLADYGGTNLRFILIVPPEGNTETIIIKWNTADTGKYLNPNGVYIDTFDPAHVPTTLRIVAGAAIAGVLIAFF